ncbi:MAG: hypothetical protein ACREJQ_07360, partial [bacterium]
VNGKAVQNRKFGDARANFDGNIIGLRLRKARLKRGILFSISSYVNGRVWVDRTPYRSVILNMPAGADARGISP